LLNRLNEYRDNISLFKINKVCQLKQNVFSFPFILFLRQLFARILFDQKIWIPQTGEKLCRSVNKSIYKRE